MMSRKMIPLVILLITLSGTSICFSQPYGIDLDEMYAYPLGFALDISSYSPILALGTDFDYTFSISDISATASYPLPRFPVWQPYVSLGLVSYTSTDTENETQASQFNHRQPYITAGITYLTKMSKQMEIGGSAGVGFSESYFSELGGSSDTVGQLNLLAELNGHLGLNISYNLHLAVVPSIRYTKTFGLLERFNGFTFGLGFTGQYRLGEDPDSPKAELKSIRFLNGKVSNIFSALQSYYVNNKIGTVTFVNDDKYPLTNVDVSFFQAGLMDTPTLLKSFDRIDSMAENTLDIFASFNTRVFETTGTTPLTGEVIVEYTSRGRTYTQKLPLTYDMYDKEALSWDDTRKAAAFVTSSDSALRNYSSYVRQVSRERNIPGYSEEIQTAMQIYYGLKELGLIYQLDPTSPFDQAQGNTGVIDAVSIPRNTLKRLTGDCDDLSVLYASLLESAGVETAFVTVPGHIYVAFNTTIPSREYQLVHPAQNMSLNINNQLWIPIEVTMIGTDDFLSAWRTGIQEFDTHKDNPESREIINIRQAQQTYRAVGLQETDLGLQYGDSQTVARNFSRDINQVINDIIASYTSIADKTNNKSGYNQLGIVSAKFRHYTEAEKAFNMALSLDRNFLSARINLANVYFQRNEFQNALRILHAVEKEYVAIGRESSRSHHIVLLNISRCYYSLENFDMAEEYLAKLKELDPTLANQNAYLGAQNGSRASRGGTDSGILFVEED